MAEIRRDIISNRWTIINENLNFNYNANENFFNKLPDNDKNCPFCKENNYKLKNIIYEVEDENIGKIKVIPNKNPYLTVETELKKTGYYFFDALTTTGANEVIIEGEKHNLDFDKMEIQSVLNILKVYKDRFLDLKKDIRLKTILIYKDRLKTNSIHHLFSQLIALPFIPEYTDLQNLQNKKYYDFKKHCLYCDLVSSEKDLNKRIIKENEDFLLIIPFAPRENFEMQILPKRHAFSFIEITDTELINLAEIFKIAIYKINKALNYPDYSYIIYSAPFDADYSNFYHWHINILPYTKSLGAKELLSGIYVLNTYPEEMTEYLKDI